MTQSQSQSVSLPPSLTTGYDVLDGAFNEMLQADRVVKPHWQELLKGYNHLGAEGIARRWQSAQRVIQENGVTYNVYGDPRGMHRPWELDPIPLVISQDEWAYLEQALVQRAHLLNLVLADLYGEQTLLKNRSLPSDLMYANPNFLRPCVGLQPQGGNHLTLVAFDLARNPNGSWWVINDRTQAPSGAGYSLENRLIISRTFPDIFRDCGVTRLARFFSRLRETLARISPQHSEDPNVVVLTPGPHNETYFEHAYLSRYLGLTLVEGGDLTVRDSKVYLKTLGGLQRVDVILRRLDDGYCDPLELRQDSALGVPGLVQAVAAGNVAVANALGSGLVETQSLMPFLGPLCKDLLGEEIKLPSVATWWCGQPKELTYVLDNLERLVIKGAFAGDPRQPVFGAHLSKEEQAQLKEKIKQRPHRFVAQESVTLSAAPTWRDGALRPRHVMLRAFVAATADGYMAMPGGLARVSGARDSMIVTMQHGGGSKDTWVLTDEPISTFSLLQTESRSQTVRRTGYDLPSRVADTMYWLGRYVERADNLTQLLRPIFVRMTAESSPHGCPELPSLMATLATLTTIDPDEGPIEQPLEEVDRTLSYLARMVDDAALVGSLRSDVTYARQLGSIVRDRISLDTWRIVGQMDRTLIFEPHELNDPTAILGVLDRMVMPLAAFAGMCNESMTHGPGWRFLDIGRRLERAIAMVTAMHELLLKPTESETAVLDALLAVAGSEMTYRSRYRMSVAAKLVIDLLLLDESNPRSVAFQIARIEQHIAALPQDVQDGERSAVQRMVLTMLSSLRLAELDQLVALDDMGTRQSLEALLENLHAQLPEFSDLLIRQFLTHAQPGRPLSPVIGELALGEEATL